MQTHPPCTLRHSGGSLQVFTNFSSGFLMDIQIIGLQPPDNWLIREIAKDARDIIAIRALNKEHAGKSPQQKNMLQRILRGVTIVPVDAARIFLQSTDCDLLDQFFGTTCYPGFCSLHPDPREIAFLEQKQYGGTHDFSDPSLRCWTRTGKLGRYVHCAGGYAGNTPGERRDPLPPTTSPPAREGYRPINTRPGGEKGPKITFDPGISDDVDARLADILEKVAQDLGKDINISSTTGGKHAKGSAHYDGRAVDINRIGGRHVKDGKNGDNVRALQDAFDKYKDLLGANYGPAKQKEFKGPSAPWADADNQKEAHEDHVHVGLRKPPKK